MVGKESNKIFHNENSLFTSDGSGSGSTGFITVFGFGFLEILRVQFHHNPIILIFSRFGYIVSDYSS